MSGYLLYGSSLSPFSVKVRVLCRHAHLDYVWLPRDGGLSENLRVQARRLALTLGRGRPVFALGPLDELPLVPFLFGPEGDLVDSSAIGRWLQPRVVGLVPEDPWTRFLCRFVDEAFDELGLYLLHHHRWVTSGETTAAVARLQEEFSPMLGPLVGRMAARFGQRQVRRLPYLFSVAPVGFEGPRSPPSRSGFPETHRLLDDLLDRWLGAIDAVLEQTPFLLGEHFSLADASLYGFAASILDIDPTTAERLGRRAPHLVDWVERVSATTGGPGECRVSEAVAPLLRVLSDSFVPLMKQNHRAFERHWASGVRDFNEHAFDRGVALYDGQIGDRPFRSVAKSFQSRVWREIVSEWRELPSAACPGSALLADAGVSL